MKVTVGGRERIQSFSLAILPGEDAWIEFFADDWLVRLNLVLESDPSHGDVSRVRIEGAGDHAILKIVNWDGPLPIAFTTPIVIGHHAKGDLVAIAHGHSVNRVALVNLDFFWGNKNV